MDTAGRIWEGDSVQLATKEVRLTLILWMHGAGGSPGQPSETGVTQSCRQGRECNGDFATVNTDTGDSTSPK